MFPIVQLPSFLSEWQITHEQLSSFGLLFLVPAAILILIWLPERNSTQGLAHIIMGMFCVAWAFFSLLFGLYAWVVFLIIFVIGFISKVLDLLFGPIRPLF